MEAARRAGDDARNQGVARPVVALVRADTAGSSIARAADLSFNFIRRSIPGAWASILPNQPAAASHFLLQRLHAAVGCCCSQH
jgi:hypothetical protein